MISAYLLKLRCKLAYWFRVWAEKLDPKELQSYTPSDNYKDLIPAALIVVARVDKMPHTGAFKKAIAMKAMMNNFRNVRMRTLSKAIEFALDEYDELQSQKRALQERLGQN